MIGKRCYHSGAGLHRAPAGRGCEFHPMVICILHPCSLPASESASHVPPPPRQRSLYLPDISGKDRNSVNDPLSTHAQGSMTYIPLMWPYMCISVRIPTMRMLQGYCKFFCKKSLLLPRSCLIAMYSVHVLHPPMTPFPSPSDGGSIFNDSALQLTWTFAKNKEETCPSRRNDPNFHHQRYTSDMRIAMVVSCALNELPMHEPCNPDEDGVGGHVKAMPLLYTFAKRLLLSPPLRTEKKRGVCAEAA